MRPTTARDLPEVWSWALDLAAHLVAREARSDAALGLVLPGPFATHLQHVMDKYKTRGYDTLEDAAEFGRYVIPVVRDEVAKLDRATARA